MSKSPLRYYVYAYLRKSDLSPYYIGKGSGGRKTQIHTIKVPTDPIRIVIMERGLSNIGALALERRLIRWYGRLDLGTGILRNLTDGGEGALGHKHSAESKLKIGDVHRGKIVSQATRDRISEANLGLKRSDELKAKMSKNMIGRVPGPVTQETRERQSRAQKKRFEDPQQKEKLLTAANLGRNAGLESCDKLLVIPPDGVEIEYPSVPKFARACGHKERNVYHMVNKYPGVCITLGKFSGYTFKLVPPDFEDLSDG